MVETQEDGSHEAEGDDEQEPVLCAGEGRGTAGHAQKGQDLKENASKFSNVYFLSFGRWEL